MALLALLLCAMSAGPSEPGTTIELRVDGQTVSADSLRITISDGDRSIDVTIREGRFQVPAGLRARPLEHDSPRLLVALTYKASTAIIGELPVSLFSGTWDIRIFNRPFGDAMVRDVVEGIGATRARTVFQIRYVTRRPVGDLAIHHYVVG